MPEKRAYITLLGRSAWAVLNTYYAVLVEKSYYPDTIHIFAEKSYAEDLDSIIEGMRALSEEFRQEPLPIRKPFRGRHKDDSGIHEI